VGLVREIYSNGFDILNSYEIVYLRRCLFIFGAAHVVIILPRWVSTGRNRDVSRELLTMRIFDEMSLLNAAVTRR